MRVLSDWVRREPVRVFSTFAALVALANYWWPTDAWPLIVAVVVAAGGESVRDRVTPV